MVVGYIMDRTGTTRAADLCPECGVPVDDAGADLDALTALLDALTAQLRAIHRQIEQGPTEGRRESV